MITLVTGAAGFVGSRIARLLLEKGERVRALVREGSSLRAIDGLSVELVCGDLRKVSSCQEALKGVKRVFHVAADYRLWAKDPGEIYENNVTGTRNLLEAARRAGVERFVYTSTVGTIAVPRKDLPNEETRARLEEMVGHYKRSKFMAEQEAFSAAASGLPLVIVNPTTPVGAGDWKPTPTGKMILDFLNGKVPAYVDTGLNVVDVEDVARGHWLAAGRGRAGERYLLGGRNMTLKEIFDTLSRFTGQPVPRLRLPHVVALAAGYTDHVISRVFGREPHIPLEGVRMARHKMFVDCSKAERELGFRAAPVEQALERAARWYLENNYVRPGRAGWLGQVRTA
ncbi:MAG TPA: hopanoid-associated sugar epimerase [Acidobacteriota bacterium]|jgi:dihydroflavonol-4-reductase|nr:hopanoid-associated sugar epimerase [Acidobacteriota bacterium]